MRRAVSRLAFFLLGVAFGGLLYGYVESRLSLATSAVTGKTLTVLDKRAVLVGECVKWLAENGRLNELKDVKACPSLLPDKVFTELKARAGIREDRTDYREEVLKKAEDYRKMVSFLVFSGIVGTVLMVGSTFRRKKDVGS